jgi:hypothetical protein
VPNLKKKVAPHLQKKAKFVVKTGLSENRENVLNHFGLP